jgi:transcriptional regulator
MYVPPLFREDDIPNLHAAIRQAGLATLVTCGADGMEASHVPMLLDPEPAPHGTLLGHIARGNPQWKRVDAGIPALAIFQGPDAYISPALYATKRETGKVVPTWNYVAVHAYGTIEFFDERDRLLGIVTRLTDRWAVSDAPADYIDGMLRAITGFALPIARLEGKWKMSQNQPAENRAGVVDGLRAEAGRGAVADIVAERNRP